MPALVIIEFAANNLDSMTKYLKLLENLSENEILQFYDNYKKKLIYPNFKS